MSYTDALAPQAVRAHDMAREVPDDMWDSAIGQLAAHVAAGSRCLDIGIGTGAVGGRLADEGLSLIGIDCNLTMLGRLGLAHPRIPVIQGDATQLPLTDGKFSLTVMACVLHLVYDWRRALREAVRVTSQGGVLAVNIGQSGLGGRTGVSRYFADHLTSSTTLPPMPGPTKPAQVPEELVAIGCHALEPIHVSGTVRRSIADHIFRLEWNPFGWPPGTPQEKLSEAAEATRAWAATQFGNLDEPNETQVAIGFTVFRKL